MPPALPMASVAEFLERPDCQRLALALAHFLWQGAAVGVLTWCLFRWPRRLSPQGRYRLGAVALLALMACPFVTFTLCEPPAPTPRVELRTDRVAMVTADESARLRSRSSEAEAGKPPAGPMPPVAAPGIDPESAASEPTAWIQIRPWLLSVWLTGVVLLSGRLVIGTWAAWRLRRSARPCPAEWLAAAERLGRRFRFRRVPRIAVSDAARDALAVGLWRPLVVLPASWVWRLPPEVCEAVLAHELAHLRRWDLWINLLQRVAETLLFYHPAVWWLSGSLRHDRELCCDALAVAHTDDPLRYAKALEAVARLPRPTGAAVEPVLALGWRGSRMALLERVRHVLGQEGRGGRLERWSAGVLAIALPVALWVGAVTLSPASADDEDAQAVALQEDDGEGARDRDQPREGDRPRDGEREGDRPRDGERDGDRPRGEGLRDGDRPRGEGPRDGDRPRGEGLRDGDRPRGEGPRDGDRPREGFRDGDRPRGEGPRDGDRPGFRPGFPPGPPPNAMNRELIEAIQQLRREVEMLRKEVQELRGREGGRPIREGDDAARERATRERVEAERREAERDVRRSGVRRRDGERREGERRDGERPDAERPAAERPDAERPDSEGPRVERPDGEGPTVERLDAERVDEGDSARDRDAERE